MTTVLQAGNRTITAEEIIPLLASYQMLPQLLRENIIERAIAPFSCTPEETAHACQHFHQRFQLTNEGERLAWLEGYGMNQAHLENLTTRRIRIEKFKQVTWGHKLESYYLKRKAQLDQAVYSLIRLKEPGIAQELYFRIQEQEQSFGELAHQYSQGREAQTGGLVGPVELGTLHPHMARLLSISQPGQLWEPRALEEWQVIVRLEQLLPAQFNEFMRQRLLNELFEGWLHEQLDQLPDSDKIWMGVAPNRPADVINHPTAA